MKQVSVIFYARNLHRNILIGSKPAQAVAYLRQLTTIPFLPHDVHSMNPRFRREKAHRLNSNYALIRHLEDQGIQYRAKISANNRIEYLFIAYPNSIDLARSNQVVAIVDNTYNTNKFEMPLLHIVRKVSRRL